MGDRDFIYEKVFVFDKMVCIVHNEVNHIDCKKREEEINFEDTIFNVI